MSASISGIPKPNVDKVRGASPAIVITQSMANKNPRSTVGTQSDIYTDLRMLYEKLHRRTCPHCGAVIDAAACKEETEKHGGDFHVFMRCSHCGERMDKLTRTDFSFNTKEGACPVCEGLGKIHTVDEDRILDPALSLEEGAVRFWEKRYGKYRCITPPAALVAWMNRGMCRFVNSPSPSEFYYWKAAVVRSSHPRCQRTACRNRRIQESLKV